MKYDMLKTVILFLIYTNGCYSKYVEGYLKTYQNWVFLARFCFLSEYGQFEYKIEFNSNQGVPNILLYYDSDDQWPAVYKKDMTCSQKERVLSIKNNQIVNLSVQYPYNEHSGCRYQVTPTNKKSKSEKLSKSITYHMSLREIINRSKYASTFDKFAVETFNNIDLNGDNNTNSTWNETEATEAYSTTYPSTTTEVLHQLWNIRPKDAFITCHNARRFRSARERWWFIAVSNCNHNAGIELKYQLRMTNGPPGAFWHEHFSADEFYVLPLLMIFAIIYTTMLLGITICYIKLKSRQLLHSTYKLFMISVELQFIGIMILNIAFLKYAADGVIANKMKVFGNILLAASETCYLLMVLLLAKGFTITRGRLSRSQTVHLTTFMCLYTITYLAIFIYEEKVFDPGEVLYLYESPAGIGLIILRVIAWCMFIYSTVFTLKHYPEKSNFYYPFNIFGTLWFISGPAFILTANAHIDKWVRESVVCGILLFIAFAGHISFLILTLPSYANKNFPYHIRTTQIGIMEVSNEDNESPLNGFHHSMYSPTAGSNSLTEQTTIATIPKPIEGFIDTTNPNRFSINVFTVDFNPNVNANSTTTNLFDPIDAKPNFRNQFFIVEDKDRKY